MPIKSYNNISDHNTDNSNANTGAKTQAATASQVIQIDLPKGLIDMHAKSYEPVLFRDKEIFNLMTVLNKMKKPNALLIGRAGSGKTAIVNELVHLIDTKAPSVPQSLKDMHLYELSLTQLASGNSIVGDTEQAIQDVINFALDPQNKAIIFIDEVHQLFDTSDNQMTKLSQALKPAMARSGFHFIGATTTGESKTVLKDPAMSRRIESVRLHNLTAFETQEIVKAVLPAYEAYHHIQYVDDIDKIAVDLADKNYVQSARPDNVLTLLDQAFSLKSMEYQMLTAPLANNLSALATLSPSSKTVDKDTLIKTINNHTGNSASATPSNIENTLLNNVKGQDDAIKQIAEQVTLFRSKIMPNNTPLSLLLAGPTGNGKTETAKTLTKALYNDEQRMTTINMTEYSNPASLNQLLGSPDGYIGSDSKRTTPFDKVYENPTQILLLDEFEKAHKDVQHIFYQILEEGYLEDRRGRTIDFSHSILIFTSNADTGANNKAVGFNLPNTKSTTQSKTELINALSQSIPDALLNRMTAIYVYNSISKETYKNILSLHFKKLISQMQENDPNLIIDPNMLSDDMLEEWTNASYNPLLNGRPAKKYVQEKVSQAALNALKNNTNQITL